MARGIVLFRQDKCKGCELCISVCPVKIIALNSDRINSKGYHYPGLTDPTKCTACGSCGIICPDGAISVCKEE